MRYAVIDVGANSVKLHVGECHGAQNWRTIVDRSEVTRLGDGLAETGEISPQAIERTVAAIAGMADEARRSGAQGIIAVGTAGLRMARNGAAAAATIRARTGIAIDIISGAEESRLGYLAVMAGLETPKGLLVVFDTGGGSTQFTFGRDGRVDEQFSVNVGAARLTEKFRLDQEVGAGALRDALSAISADLSRIDGRAPPDTLVGMGGAVTNIAAVQLGLSAYDPNAVRNTALDRGEVNRQIELYRARDAAGRRSIAGLQPRRAEVILAGACVVGTVMDKLGKDSLIVSDRGVRHGVLAERCGG
ncbi:MAG TPA: hypothetical protein VFV70_04105 [Hyphomonadaceae bacterium]|nr:hypothetical protein [Hyphomonadaceae bacterium]